VNQSEEGYERMESIYRLPGPYDNNSNCGVDFKSVERRFLVIMKVGYDSAAMRE